MCKEVHLLEGRKHCLMVKITKEKKQSVLPMGARELHLELGKDEGVGGKKKTRTLYCRKQQEEELKWPLLNPVQSIVFRNAN